MEACVMEQSGIGGFSISNIMGSSLTIGNGNNTVADLVKRSADPVLDWTDVSHPALKETPFNYEYRIHIGHLNPRSVAWDKLTLDDVRVQLEKSTIHVHQTVDLKVFVNLDRDGEGDWDIFKHRIKLPRDAKLEKMEYRITEGVLIVIWPKEANLAEPYNGGGDRGGGKRKRKDVDAAVAPLKEGIHLHSC